MQVTIDIPEGLYQALQTSADEENTTVTDIVQRKVATWASVVSEPSRQGKRVKFPLIRGIEPGPLMREDINLNHVAWMDDDEINELLAGR